MKLEIINQLFRSMIEDVDYIKRQTYLIKISTLHSKSKNNEKTN